MYKRFAVRNFQTSIPAFGRILATDGVDEVCIKIFQERGHQVDFLKTMPEPELIKIIGDYDGLVVRSATKVTPPVIKAAKKMKIIGRAGVGVDNINVSEATKAGIMVMNTPGGNTISTAQLALSLLSSLARNIPAADMSIKAGEWDRKSFTGVELNGKVLGIIGCGRIGQVVAQTAMTLGMSVVGYDPVMTNEQFAELAQTIPLKRAATVDDIYNKSDFITVHTPLTPETSNLLNDAAFSKCKKGVRIINCARGGIVDEAALLRALESGQVAGAALDVFTSEPPKEHLQSLVQHPRLICTPHLGASTDEAQVNVARDIAVQMCDTFENKDFLGVVNVSYLAASTQPHIKPFMTLAKTIGTMMAQLSSKENPPISMTLKTYGGRDVNITTKQARQLLEAKVLMGMVKHLGLGLVPDLISAPIMARDLAKIQSTISTEPPTALRTSGSPYWNLLSAEVERKDGSKCSITGAVFGSAPHIIQVDEFSDLFAFRPEGNYILTFRNEDRPGAISEVLDVLQRANVNIASMNVARGNGTRALTFMALDDDVSTNAMSTLQSLSFLTDVAKIQLQ